MTDYESGLRTNQEIIHDLVGKAHDELMEWANRTRPTLSEPAEGFEWRLHVGFPSMEAVGEGDLQVTFPHEWLLVRVGSAS